LTAGIGPSAFLIYDGGAAELYRWAAIINVVSDEHLVFFLHMP